GEDGTVQFVYPPRQGAQGPPLAQGHPIGALAFRPVGNQFWAAGPAGGCLWDLSTRQAPVGFPERSNGPRRAAVGPSGRTVTVAGDGGKVQMWEATDRAALKFTLRRLDKGPGEADVLALTPDQKNLLVVPSQTNRQVQVWDVTQRLPRPRTFLHDA